jgi:hypothetical protein
VRSQRTAHGFTSLALADEHVLALAKLPALHRDDKRHTCGYAAKVKTYAWSTEKNDFLQRERGVSFEDVVLNIQLGNEIDVVEHPNQERYPGQKISVVLIEGYAYLVPFVEAEDEIFLKTIIPSRKATKHYAGGTDEQT